ncbi:hypothetical protein QE428_002620 [Microbacterium sp. SORGH_AS 505]|uniref:hypothetical protein n=1 Tax=Microbacterium sp. SORGH_AS_0505 TaxID=3041770 RepID=UPI002786C4A9|nr:hypothetical protein [Microbacterium sp. SORGH_AS_0505]MDQ1127587.1 hypothetical protein [Microbacterium sp. SORGH_AS_0505]
MPTADTHAAGTGLNETTGRAYCGRKNKDTTKIWKAVTCADCHAARRADEEAQR